MSRLQGLIFTAEGALAETDEVRRIAGNEALKKAQIHRDISRADYGRLVACAPPDQRLRRHIAALAREPDHRALEILPQIVAEERRVYTRLVENGAARFIPGARRLIDEARTRQLRLAVVGAAPKADLETLLIANLDTDGPKQFEVILGQEAGDVGALYGLAAESMGLPAANVVCFAHSEREIAAILAGGMRAIGLPGAYTAADDLSSALAVVSHYGEPFEPFDHIAGAGERDALISLSLIASWLADDDDLRGLLTIGGRSIMP